MPSSWSSKIVDEAAPLLSSAFVGEDFRFQQLLAAKHRPLEHDRRIADPPGADADLELVPGDARHIESERD